MQIFLENDANHRALRRCHSCGAYSRPSEGNASDGTIRCRPCSEKAERRERGSEDEEKDPTRVSFLV